jgi:hypothetical protein
VITTQGSFGHFGIINLFTQKTLDQMARAGSISGYQRGRRFYLDPLHHFHQYTPLVEGGTIGKNKMYQTLTDPESIMGYYW